MFKKFLALICHSENCSVLANRIVKKIGSYSRSRYELENKCVIHSGCVVVVWSLVGLWVSTVVEIDCCDNCSRVAWLVAVRKFL